MNRLLRTTLAVLAVLCLSVGPALAQTPTLVQQSATMLTACTAANATAAVNNAVTLTITPPPGQYVYLCGLDITVAQAATSPVNTSVSFPSTNWGGWAWKYSLAPTANLTLVQPFYFASPVKSSAAGTAV